MRTKEQKIDKLLKEYNFRVIKYKTDINVLLIDFAREYNKIWSEEDV